MQKIIPDLLLAMQDLQNKNHREIREALFEVDQSEHNLIVNQVKRLYKILDIENHITYGTLVNGGYVAGIQLKNGKPVRFLIDGPECHEWRPAELVYKAA